MAKLKTTHDCSVCANKNQLVNAFTCFQYQKRDEDCAYYE